MKKQLKAVICAAAAVILGLLGSQNSYAEEDAGIGEFVGEYLCDVETPGEYGNPEVLSLAFNGEGHLTRVSRLYYATLGTTMNFDYRDYEIEGNILTCYYDGAYGAYGTVDDVEAGSHQFILADGGNLIEDNHIWYRWVRDQGETEEVHSGTLPAVTDIDFPYGAYTPDAPFLGIKELTRKEITSICFLDTLEETSEYTPEYIWDVSEAQDGSVELWINKDEEGCHVYIAADGGVTANGQSNDLFRLCTSLTEIDFNYAFDTSTVSDFSYMFYGCEAIRELDLRDFATDWAQDMSKMFYGCKSLDTLRIDNFVFTQNCRTEDIFTGTKWEGSSPLLDYGDTVITTACILNTSVLLDSPLLRARVINEYDNMLTDLIKDKVSISGKWKDTSCYIFYSMKDINEDGIPELIIRTDTKGSYTFTIYYFDIVSCTVRWMGGAYQANWPELYLYPDEHVLNYHTEYGDKYLTIEGSTIRELYDYDAEGLKSDGFDYTLSLPQYQEYYKTDLLGDGSQNEVMIKASINGAGGYNYLAIYIDSIRVLGKELSGRYSEIEYDPFYTEGRAARELNDEEEDEDKVKGQNAIGDREDFLYLHVGSESDSEYTALLEYRDDSFSENLVMSELVEESQLRSDIGNDSYFDVSVEKNGDLKVTFYLNTYGLGDQLEFSLRYTYYSSSGFKQRTFVADIDNSQSMSRNVTAKKKFSAFDRVGSRNTAYTVNAGEHVHYDKIWFSNGLIWIRIENEAGEKGWIPAGDDSLFEEVRENSDGSSLWRGIVNRIFDGRYFDLDLPSSDILYSLGKERFDEGDFDTAEIYFDLIDKESTYYDQMQEMLDNIHEKSSDASSEEVEVLVDGQSNGESGAVDEKILYAKYINENVGWLGEDGGYAVLDINGDGRKELLIYYGQSNGNCEVYTFNEQSSKVQYAGIIEFAEYDLYYSQQYQSLVRFYRVSDGQTYDFYGFDGENLDYNFRVGWHDVKEETYTRYFSYSDKNGRRELGHYVYAGEQENVGKEEAERNYYEYLQYMMEIEFTPTDDFLYDNGQAYTYELSTDNIPINDMECMLPVIYTYLNSGRGIKDNSSGRITFDTSYKKEDLWEFLWIYSIYTYKYNMGEYTMDEIQKLAYSLFADYDGMLPELPQGSFIQCDGDIVTFIPVTPEERSVSLLEFEVLEDGSVDAIYSETVGNDEDYACKIFVHLVKNKRVDYFSYDPLYYRIDSLESQPESIYPDIPEENSLEDEFIFADSDSRYLTIDDLAGLDADTLRYARNEIYARRGRRFNDQELQSYFDSKSWYQGIIAPEDFQESMLSDIERKNAELILDYENDGQ